jgi:hypothetical protein
VIGGRKVVEMRDFSRVEGFFLTRYSIRAYLNLPRTFSRNTAILEDSQNAKGSPQD